MLEVTSSVNLPTCKSVMEQLITSMLECGLCSCHETSTTPASDGGNEEDNDRPQELIIEQVRVVNHEGQLKVVYPSRVDLQLEAAKIVYEEKA